MLTFVQYAKTHTIAIQKANSSTAPSMNHAHTLPSPPSGRFISTP